MHAPIPSLVFVLFLGMRLMNQFHFCCYSHCSQFVPQNLSYRSQSANDNRNQCGFNIRESFNLPCRSWYLSTFVCSFSSTLVSPATAMPFCSLYVQLQSLVVGVRLCGRFGYSRPTEFWHFPFLSPPVLASLLWILHIVCTYIFVFIRYKHDSIYIAQNKQTKYVKILII